MAANLAWNDQRMLSLVFVIYLFGCHVCRSMFVMPMQKQSLTGCSGLEEVKIQSGLICTKVWRALCTAGFFHWQSVTGI